MQVGRRCQQSVAQTCSCRVMSRFYPNHRDISLDDVNSVGNDQYTVFSSKRVQTYDVDMQLDTCTCEAGKNGAPCKHQAAVVKTFGVVSLNFLPVHSIAQRKQFYFIATGNSPSDRWFQSLHDGLLDNMDDNTDNRGDNDDDDNMDNNTDNRDDDDHDNDMDNNRGGNDNLDTNTDNSGDNNDLDTDDTNRGNNDDLDSNDDNHGDNDDMDTTADNCCDNDDMSANTNNHCDNNNTSNMDDKTDHSGLEEELLDVFNDLSKHLDANPAEYAAVVRSFVKSYRSISTDSHRLSALHTFSKFQASLLERNIKSTHTFGSLHLSQIL